MKNAKVILVARMILGLILVVFGLNKFFPFMPFPPMPEAAGALMGALVASGYLMIIIGIVEIVVGVMLLTNKYVALALLLLAPITVNIITFHLFLDIAGIGGAALVTILNVFLLFVNKDKYNKILSA